MEVRADSFRRCRDFTNHSAKVGLSAHKRLKMRIEFDPEDRKALALDVLEVLRPFLGRVDKTSTHSDTIFDVKALCEYLKVTPKWVYEQTHLNAIPHYKLTAKALRFKRSEIDDWLRGLTQPATSEPTGLMRLLKEKRLPRRGKSTVASN